MTKPTFIVALTAVATALIVESFHQFLESKKNSKPVSKPSTTGSQTDASSTVRTSKNTIVHYSQPHPQELIDEQLARNSVFLTPQGLESVRNLKVIVIGAGGVGSNAIVSLIRSGVSHMRIVDFDQVSLSSLNRHAIATLHDVGRSKVDILVEWAGKVAPWAHVEGINMLFSGDKSNELLYFPEGKPDFVIDCIDNIDTKVELLAFCHEQEIPVVSSMGAACKSDPTRINIGDISVSDEDPLARSVRRRLKKMGITRGITTVFSAEKPDPRKASLLPLPDEEFERGPVDELTAMQNFRVRILPVLGTMPGIFGLAIATHVVTVASGYPIEYPEGKNRFKVYDQLLQSVAGQQARIGYKDQRTPWVALSDVRYILDEIWRGKSPISGISTRLCLSRWDPTKELGMQNVIVMTKDEQRVHERRCLLDGESLLEVYGEEVCERIEKRFKEEEWFSQFR
ncbi:tRNA threonylcarbamoyladenosine dehydratase [Martiniozyma asiatica (nom. inval.)]|nr:tRNA threonylcarbamoyladenosine dehydratase [Martiniozyma asiatica]